MDILTFFQTDETTKLDWRQFEPVRLAQAQSREATHRFELAAKKRIEVWGWRTDNDPRLRLEHFTQWAAVDLEHKQAELSLHESQTSLMKIETTAKASVRDAWEQLFAKAFASVEQITSGELSDRLGELGQLWDEANGCGIAFPVALTSVTLSPQGLSEWSQAVKKELGS